MFKAPRPRIWTKKTASLIKFIVREKDSPRFKLRFFCVVLALFHHRTNFYFACKCVYDMHNPLYLFFLFSHDYKFCTSILIKTDKIKTLTSCLLCGFSPLWNEE